MWSTARYGDAVHSRRGAGSYCVSSRPRGARYRFWDYKIRAYALQDLGYDTVDANLQLGFPIDAREYGMAAQVLKDLQLTSVRLITHNPRKFFELQRLGIHVLDRIILPSVFLPKMRGICEQKGTHGALVRSARSG